MVDAIPYGCGIAYGQGFQFRCWVCDSVVGGWSGPGYAEDDEIPGAMQLCAHTLPCPMCGNDYPKPPPEWPRGKPRPLP